MACTAAAAVFSKSTVSPPHEALLFLFPCVELREKAVIVVAQAPEVVEGGACVVREEPGKQKPRSCRAQELARSRAQEGARQKKASVEISEHRDEERTGVS